MRRLTTIEFLPEIQISHSIECKKITTIHPWSLGKEMTFQQDNGIKRILVVDDEYDVSSVIKLVLENNGFKVDSFTDASEALENFTTDTYDLVILDVIMPEMNGFSLYEKIKKLDDKVTICFLTATHDAYYEILKKDHPGINENCVIHKPVDNESLLERIKSVL